MTRFPAPLAPLFLFLALLLGALTACNDGGDPGDRTAAPSKAGRPVVRLLTWRYLTQDREWVSKFEERYRAEVRVTVRPTSAIVAAVRAGEDPGADVILLPTLEDAVRLREFGALQPFFVNTFTTGRFDDRWGDNEGYYAAVGRWTMATVYNPKTVAQDEATSFLGLAKGLGRGIRLGLAHPDSSGLAGLVAGLNAVVNPQAAAAWTGRVYNGADGLPHGSDADQLDRLRAGEIDLALVSSGNALRWFLNGDPSHYEAARQWRIRYPETAEGTHFLNATCVTLAAGARNRELAMRFIDNLYAKPVQEAITNAWFEYPAEVHTEANDYLYGIPDALTSDVPLEITDQNLGAAWTFINQAAAAE